MQTSAVKDSTLLINAKELAEMLSVSPRHIWRMKAAGKLPRAIEIGHCVRWKLLDISNWLAMDCPAMKEFKTRQAARKS